MNYFRLQPWEVGPRCREKLGGAADGTVKGSFYRVVEMKRRKFVVFVQESLGQSTSNWIVASTDENQPQTWPNTSWFSKFGCDAEWVSTIGRFFAWGEDMAFLSASGEGAWLNVHLEAEIPFKDAAPRDLIERDNAATFAHLTHHLDGQSDFAFARSWKTFERESKLSALYGESLEEMRSLMRSVLLLTPFSSPAQQKWRWSLSLNEDNRSRLYSGDWKYSQREPDFLYEWAQLLIEYITPRAARPIQIHPCVAQFATTTESHVEVESQSYSSQHEHLEARLHLREWLHHNTPERLDLIKAL